MATKAYANSDITIHWDPSKCIHSGVCVQMLPQVYHPKDKPWIKIENADTKSLIDQIGSCPSGALTFTKNKTMEIVQFDRDTKGHFKAVENEMEAGIMTYSHAGPDKIIIDHTEVHPSSKGRDVGKKLVMAAVGYARKNAIKIIPLCPFAKSVFDRAEEIRDVLA